MGSNIQLWERAFRFVSLHCIHALAIDFNEATLNERRAHSVFIFRNLLVFNLLLKKS